MKENKFRGKAVLSIEKLEELGIKHENGWIIGNFINSNKPLITGGILDISEEYLAPEFWVEVIPETVGQYIVKKDNLKREIFEDDIVEAYVFDSENKEKTIGKIGFNEGRGGYIFTPVKYESKNLYYPVFAIISCDVIGNIHDTPGLLKIGS